MTLKSMVNTVLAEIGMDTVASVVGTTDPRSGPIFSVAKRALEEVSLKYSWPHLEAVHSFDTVDGTAEYTLPDDFDKLLTDTAYDTSQDYRLRGGVTPGEWRAWEVLNDGGASQARRFKISGYPRKFKLTPTPDLVIPVSFLYRSNNFAVDNGGTLKPTFTADTDTPAIGERLVSLDFKWRYLRQRGLDYAEDFREAKEAAEQAYAESKSEPSLTLGGDNHSWNGLTDGSVPDRNYGP